MALIPDPWLIVLQAIPFALAILLLDRIIYRPMLAYLLDREEAIEGSRRRAAELQAEVERAVGEYEQRLAEARKRAAALRKQLRDAALAEREALLARERQAAEAEVDEAVARIREAREAAAQELEKIARQLAGEIARRVLPSAEAA